MRRSYFQNRKNGMVSLGRWAGLSVMFATLGGCGAELSRQDLGTVGFEVPKVAGSEKPYEMPELGPPLEVGDNPH